MIYMNSIIQCCLDDKFWLGQRFSDTGQLPIHFRVFKKVKLPLHSEPNLVSQMINQDCCFFIGHGVYSFAVWRLKRLFAVSFSI